MCEGDVLQLFLLELCDLLTSCYRIFFEKLIATHLVKE
jgi:hypothetical protein